MIRGHPGFTRAGVVLVMMSLFVGGGLALESRPPVVLTVLEARDPATDAPMLVLVGKYLKGILEARLEDASGPPGTVLGVISPGSTQVSLALPADLLPGPYELVLVHGSPNAPEELRHLVSVSAGNPLPGSVLGVALDPELAEDLEDAETLGGEDLAFHEDAGHFDAGVLAPQRYSAHADLVEEGDVGPEGRLVPGLYSAWEDLEAEGVVVDGKLHPDRYSAAEDLEAEGRMDGLGRIVPDHFSAWADLQDEGYVTGGGLLHPDRYSAWGALEAAGRVDGTGNLGGQYLDAYADLVAESRVGAGASQVAAGDHEHEDRYLESFGANTLTGYVFLDARGTSPNPTVPLLWALTSTEGTAALKVTQKAAGTALDTANLKGSSDSVALVAKQTATTGKVYGLRIVDERGADGTSLWAKAGLVSVLGSNQSPDGFGIHVRSRQAPLRGATASKTQWRLGIQTVHGGTSGDIAVFQVGTTNQARIDRTGQGFFNGGTQTGGADFAESVKVTGAADSLEAGDVVSIDAEAERGFALCKERSCRRVAGVVSTRPGVLGTPHEVAGTNREWAKEEVPLAIVGIVPVKVCDENGPVRAGDLLVSASLPGHAMKAPAEPEPGTVLGKSLGALKGSRGKVETLLMVQ